MSAPMRRPSRVEHHECARRALLLEHRAASRRACRARSSAARASSHSSTRRARIESCRCNVRRRSPSVKMPSRRSRRRRCSHADALPRHLDDRVGEQRLARRCAAAARPLRMMSSTRTSRRRPSAPPGCAWRNLAREAARVEERTASASPSASAAVCSRWARRLGAASFSTAASRCRRPRASVDEAWPGSRHLRAATLDHRQDRMISRLARVRDRQHHIVALDHAEVAVARLTRCMKNAGVPVEASVEAIFPATWPGLAHAGQPPRGPRLQQDAMLLEERGARRFFSHAPPAFDASTTRASSRKSPRRKRVRL